MDRTQAFFLVMLVSAINGIFSGPLLIFFFQAAAVLLAFVSPSINVVFFFAALLGATFTLAISGVPAAIFERLTGREDSDLTSTLIWLAAAIVLSLPALMHILGYFT